MRKMAQVMGDRLSRSIRGHRPLAGTMVNGAVLAAVICCTFAHGAEPLPAFPEAEGCGAKKLFHKPPVTCRKRLAQITQEARSWNP